jgi:hypothetical protein
VIGFLRFIGLVNAAIWLGTSVFFSFGAGRAVFSSDMRTLLGENNFPFFSGAIAYIILQSYFHFSVICGVIALLHLGAEKLYLGRHRSSFTVYLLVSLVAVTLAGGLLLQPKLHDLHDKMHSQRVSPEDRAAATHTFRVWHGFSMIVNLFVIGGIVIYTWRVNNPPDPTRFVVPPSKFGG